MKGNATPTGPVTKLYELGFAHIASKCAMIAAEKKLNEILLPGETVPVSKISEHLGYELLQTIQFLQVLNAYGLIELIDESSVKATELTAHLQYFLGTHIKDAYAVHLNLENVLQSGTAGWKETYGKTFYEYVSSKPGEVGNFADWLKITALHWLKAVTDIYDFSQCDTVADIGGSTGEVLLRILHDNTKQKGVLFDLPDVIKQAEADLKNDPAINRLTLVGGSYFDKLPAGADLYTLVRVLLNLSDDDAVRVLNNLYNTMEVGARALILDFVLPPREDPAYKQAVLSSMNLLAVLNSTNRSKIGWSNVVSRSKFGTFASFKTTDPEYTARHRLFMPLGCIELVKEPTPRL